ncbi:hypothetical protein I6A84_35215 [Frankia sp. CNm7]|uniref:GerMN domain-containing protein n=1 Tax=Frankia nepalensis TaxID=1836974 RepID=A0A937UNM4_9ACTN|nr:hypothetical protein [Frankia nepalensis]MBL7495858.1 hypothetical protein [Frankia nepalensis]MBL7515966.1 hypothetical protein [Frankia nepalensis]MBL7523198.1 hypothetical protein [Frankia nepalensis]MBL7630014.1 hypothetical protein [Frankia nepalensis]
MAVPPAHVRLTVVVAMAAVVAVAGCAGASESAAPAAVGASPAASTKARICDPDTFPEPTVQPEATGPVPGLGEPGFTPRPVPDPLPLDALGPFERADQELALEFPTTYGGWLSKDMGTYTVLTVGEPSAELVAAVERQLAELPDELIASGMGEAIVRRAPLPTAVFSPTARFSLVQLQDTARSLRPALDCPGVWGVGQNRASNQVVLNIDGSTAGRQSADEIVADHPAGMIDVQVGDVPTAGTVPSGAVTTG